MGITSTIVASYTFKGAQVVVGLMGRKTSAHRKRGAPFGEARKAERKQPLPLFYPGFFGEARKASLSDAPEA